MELVIKAKRMIRFCCFKMVNFWPNLEIVAGIAEESLSSGLKVHLSNKRQVA
jgi:hypothetical protein